MTSRVGERDGSDAGSTGDNSIVFLEPVTRGGDRIRDIFCLLGGLTSSTYSRTDNGQQCNGLRKRPSLELHYLHCSILHGQLAKQSTYKPWDYWQWYGSTEQQLGLMINCVV